MDEKRSFSPDTVGIIRNIVKRIACGREIAPSFRCLVQFFVLAVVLSVQIGCKDLPITKNRAPVGAPSPEVVALQNQLNQMNERFAALERSNAQINTQLAQTQQSLLLEQQTNQNGRQEYAALEETNKRLRGENQEYQSKIAQMADQAKGMIELGTMQPSTAIVPNSSMDYSINLSDVPGVQTRRVGSEYHISFPSTQLFSDDKISLTENGKAALITVMQRINESFKSPSLRIEAHSGQFQEVSASDPTLNSPQGLTARQAINVSEALKGAGVPLPDKTTVSGCGNSFPLVTSSTDEGKEANQRVEFIVIP